MENHGIIFLSRKDAESFHDFNGSHLISITDPGSPDARVISEYPILRLKFYDIDRSITTLDGQTHFPLTEEDADKIAEYVLKQWEQIGILAIHCEAGLSRSAAVGGAISKYLYNDDEYFFKRGVPNMHVYRATLEALQRYGSMSN